MSETIVLYGFGDNDRSGKVRWLTQLQRYRKPKKRKGPIFWVGPVLAGNRPETGMPAYSAASGWLPASPKGGIDTKRCAKAAMSSTRRS